MAPLFFQNICDIAKALLRSYYDNGISDLNGILASGNLDRQKKYQPTHVLIAHNTAFEKPSVVQLEQIFTIDKSRIQRFLGQTTRHEMRRIEEALMNSLEINEWDRRNADE